MLVSTFDIFFKSRSLFSIVVIGRVGFCNVGIVDLVVELTRGGEALFEQALRGLVMPVELLHIVGGA